MSLVSQINQEAQKVSSKCGLRKHSLLPRLFFCPSAFTKGCYFHSPVTFTVTKSQMASTEVRLRCTSKNPVFARPKIRVHYLLVFPICKIRPIYRKKAPETWDWYQKWAWGNVRLNFVWNILTRILLKKGHGKRLLGRSICFLKIFAEMTRKVVSHFLPTWFLGEFS